MTNHLILGTAGHIDHGKTTLVRALTGVDTDRLPEEKQRGITIELGFADLTLEEFHFGIVDVPGHERFVRNMLAGATGVDLAMLVVAADEGVKQQTREHLDILQLLGAPAGVIVITKCDRAEPDWLELVEEDIRELVEGTFLQDAPLVKTAAATGQGIEDLKATLVEAARQLPPQQTTASSHAPFRMAIDRAFNREGFGVVVTGSVSSGTVSVGDTLLVQPAGLQARVRTLTTHNQKVETIGRGQRGALNLAGVKLEDIARGQELSAVGHLQPAGIVTVEIATLPSAPRPLKNRATVRLHAGSAEVLARVLLLDAAKLQPGESGFAQLFLVTPAATTWGQPFVLRSESPVETIGGGRVLAPNAAKLKAPDGFQFKLLDDLSHGDDLARAAAALYFAGLDGWQPGSLPRIAGVNDITGTRQALRAAGVLHEIELSSTRQLGVHRQQLEELALRIQSVMKRLHAAQPLVSSLPLDQLQAAFNYLPAEELLHDTLQLMAKDKRIRLTPRGAALAGAGPQLSNGERKQLVLLVEKFRVAGLKSPTVKECQQSAARNKESVPNLLKLAVADGDLVEVAKDYYIHTVADQAARQTLRDAMQQGPGRTLSEIRELLDVSRKYAVPYCEYLDAAGFTSRNGDLRVLAEE